MIASMSTDYQFIKTKVKKELGKDTTITTTVTIVVVVAMIVIINCFLCSFYDYWLCFEWFGKILCLSFFLSSFLSFIGILTYIRLC